jgi:caffeoyl-CoA O-methyltransferase
MDFLPEDLTAYADAHTSPEGEELRRLSRQTRAKVLYPRMLSGHFQGRLLSMLAHMMQPRRILEIGTFTGYSAICLAESLPDDGLLITIDKNEELETMARAAWADTPHVAKIDYRIGNALDLIPTLDEVFDLIFLDADKQNYARYYDLVFDKLRPGGVILADNVLWSGKVVQPVKPSDRDTQAVLAFNQKVQDDPRVENVLLPVRDGLMMIRKR